MKDFAALQWWLASNFKACVLSVRPTQRALDAGDSAHLQAFFWLRVFSAPKQSPRPPQRQ